MMIRLLFTTPTNLEYRRVFALFAEDDVIDHRGFRAVARALCINMGDEEFDRVYRAVDSDSSGALSEEDFRSFIEMIRKELE